MYSDGTELIDNIEWNEIDGNNKPINIFKV